MKKLFFIVVFFTSILSMNAQGGFGNRNSRMPEPERAAPGPQKIPTAEEMADRETKRQTALLDLTPEQVAKVKVINFNYSQQRLGLMHEMQQTKDTEAVENKLKGIRLAETNDLNAVFTAEQQAIYTKGKKPKVKDKEKKDKEKKEKGKGKEKAEKEGETKN